MTQLREGGQDLLHPGASKLDRELGALSAPLARDHDALPELRVTDAYADRIRPRVLGSRPARPRAPTRRRVDPRLLADPFEAVRRDLLAEARRAPPRRGSRPPLGAVAGGG